jgi:hypothetical protein
VIGRGTLPELPHSEELFRHGGVTPRGVTVGSPVLSPIGTRRGLVALDLGGLLGPVVDLLKGLLGAKQLVVLEESTPILTDPVERVRQIVLPAVIGTFGFLDDSRVDEALQMLSDRRLTPAQIDVVQLLQRRQPRRIPEDVLNERNPRLLGDDVESLANGVEFARGPVGGTRQPHLRGSQAKWFV